MRTIHEVSQLTGVSIRTLQYYDKIGLLPPTARTPAEYRLYDDRALARLQQILLFRELEFSLREIRDILDRPDFDPVQALEQQITLFQLKREHLDNLIAFARGIQQTGGTTMDFSAFDKTKLDRYAQQAKEKWGETSAYKEFEAKNAGRTETVQAGLAAGLMALFGEFAALKELAPSSPEVQAQVAKLQSYISEHYYTCTPQILSGLGQMYAAGGEMTENIDASAGPGTAVFAAKAIEIFCGQS